MCGIFSLFNTLLNDEQLKQWHRAFMTGNKRGPEFSTLRKVQEKAYFGFHRLAINGINVESNQPLSCEGITIICNGEIYNYKKLIKELKFKMNTDSDCEVIIHLYLLYGFGQMIQMLDGVFSFILMDLRKAGEEKVFVGRDPFGVRPLFEYASFVPHEFGFSSEIKMIYPPPWRPRPPMRCVKPFSPGTWKCYKLEQDTNIWTSVNKGENIRYFTLCTVPFVDTNWMAQSIIRRTFTDAVRKRVDNTDRPIACLLSGGLDSSLVCALVNKYYSTDERKLETYCIGLEGSVDLKYARIVADYIDSKHTEIIVKTKDFLDAIPEVIYATETFDTTTVRASVGNYLVSKYIKQHSKAKVIFNGDGSDEVCGGYMYFHNAPDCYAFDGECKRLLNDLQYFDVLRSDRCISSNGLEARTPFLDKTFVQQYLSILPKIRCHSTNNACEKFLLRSAFENENLLPDEILWRTKEAFSDGVSSLEKPWYAIIQDHVEKYKLGTELEQPMDNHMNPVTTEQKYYRKLFQDFFGEQQSNVIPYFWMPKFVKNATDASARTLDIYKERTVT